MYGKVPTGFTQLKKKIINNNLYKMKLILYVDDMLLSGWYAKELAELQQQLQLKFTMKDLGSMHHIL